MAWRLHWLACQVHLLPSSRNQLPSCQSSAKQQQRPRIWFRNGNDQIVQRPADGRNLNTRQAGEFRAEIEGLKVQPAAGEKRAPRGQARAAHGYAGQIGPGLTCLARHGERSHPRGCGQFIPPVRGTAFPSLLL